MDWSKLDKETIFKGNDAKGNRYLSQFLSDYQNTFNPESINAGCERCLEDYYNKMIKHLNMSNKNSNTKNSGYLLKPKYEGIPMAFGSRKFVYNHTLTDEIAQEMIKNHPKGKALFQNIPEKSKSKGPEEEPLKELLKLSREELNDAALALGIENPSEFQNKNQVAEAILESKSKGSEEEE